MADKKTNSPKAKVTSVDAEQTKSTKAKQPQDGDAPKTKGNMKRGESKHSPRRIESVERQAEALEYRKMGLSYAQIAMKLQLSGPQSAWYCVEAALQRVLRESAEQVRSLELERLDAMFVPVYGNALRGDLMALDKALSIMTRRARLLGLDAPVKQEHTGKDGADLPAMTPMVILVGGDPEEGEPDIMGMPVEVPEEPEAKQP